MYNRTTIGRTPSQWIFFKQGGRELITTQSGWTIFKGKPLASKEISDYYTNCNITPPIKSIPQEIINLQENGQANDQANGGGNGEYITATEFNEYKANTERIINNLQKVVETQGTMITKISQDMIL